MHRTYVKLYDYHVLDSTNTYRNITHTYIHYTYIIRYIKNVA